MNKEIETKLIECHILMIEALKGYEDRAFQSNKLFELRQYSNQLPDEMNKKITEYASGIIRPMIYDADYWAFIEKHVMKTIILLLIATVRLNASFSENIIIYVIYMRS